MSVEMAAVTFDGTHTAEQELSALRTTRTDPWLIEVAVLEHHGSGRYSVKATSADYGEENHVRAGIAIGAGTGLLLAMIGGPLGILLWTAVGAVCFAVSDSMIAIGRFILGNEALAVPIWWAYAAAEILITGGFFFGREDTDSAPEPAESAEG